MSVPAMPPKCNGITRNTQSYGKIQKDLICRYAFLESSVKTTGNYKWNCGIYVISSPLPRREA